MVPQVFVFPVIPEVPQVPGVPMVPQVPVGPSGYTFLSTDADTTRSVHISVREPTTFSTSLMNSHRQHVAVTVG